MEFVGSTDLTQRISGLSAETTYSVKVRGINSEGNGLESASLSVTTDAAPVTNTAPVWDAASYTFTDVVVVVNTVVGTISATDADDNDLTYSLIGVEADNFDIDSDSGEITVSTALTYGQAYDFEGR